MARIVGSFVILLLAFTGGIAQDRPAEEPAPVTDSGKLPEPGGAQRSMCMLLESAARANGLPVEFFARVIWQESRFRPDAVGPLTRSGKRALGIAQFMPGTAAERNLLDPFNPIQALPKSAEFLRDLRRDFGNLVEDGAGAVGELGGRVFQKAVERLARIRRECRRHTLIVVI